MSKTIATIFTIDGEKVGFVRADGTYRFEPRSDRWEHIEVVLPFGAPRRHVDIAAWVASRLHADLVEDD